MLNFGGVYFSLKGVATATDTFLRTIGNFAGLVSLVSSVGFRLLPCRHSTPRHPIQFNLICIGKNIKQKHEKKQGQNEIFTATKINLP